MADDLRPSADADPVAGQRPVSTSSRRWATTPATPSTWSWPARPSRWPPPTSPSPRPAPQHRAPPPRAHARRGPARGAHRGPLGRRPAAAPLLPGGRGARRSAWSRPPSRCWPACWCARPRRPGLGRGRGRRGPGAGPGRRPALADAGHRASKRWSTSRPASASIPPSPARRRRDGHGGLRPLPVPGAGREPTPIWSAASTAAWWKAFVEGGGRRRRRPTSTAARRSPPRPGRPRARSSWLRSIRPTG